MIGDTARLRMFAGPNGSGKTTFRNSLGKPASWFGIYINPDELEEAIRANSIWSAEPFGVSASVDEVRRFFVTSTFLESQNLAQDCVAIEQPEHDRLSKSRI
jgi:predicted ABC-type ATPase